MTRIHADWRSKIHDVLRAKRRKKLTGDYIQQSLDYFEMLLPHLRVGCEVVMKRERVSEITERLWSESSITKFLQNLAKTEVLDCRNAGANGLGIKLLKDLTESPWKNRRPESEDEGAPEVEAPEEEDYTTTVDLDLAIEAIDVVRNMLSTVVPLQTQDEFLAGETTLAKAVDRLGKIRTALVTGDDAGLSKVINEAPPRNRTFYRCPEQP